MQGLQEAGRRDLLPLSALHLQVRCSIPPCHLPEAVLTVSEIHPLAWFVLGVLFGWVSLILAIVNDQ